MMSLLLQVISTYVYKLVRMTMMLTLVMYLLIQDSSTGVNKCPQVVDLINLVTSTCENKWTQVISFLIQITHTCVPKFKLTMKSLQEVPNIQIQ